MKIQLSFAFVAVTFIDICHAVFYNETGPLRDVQFNDNSKIYLPYVNSTDSQEFKGLFTLSRNTLYKGKGSSKNAKNCIGSIAKTWTEWNSTVGSWKAVGLLGGNCLGDFLNAPQGFIGYTSGANLTNLLAQNGQILQLSFNYFNDQNQTNYVNTTITAIHFASTKVIDILVVELNMTNAEVIKQINPVFHNFAESYDLKSSKDIKNAQPILAVTSHIPNDSVLINGTKTLIDVFPRINKGKNIIIECYVKEFT